MNINLITAIIKSTTINRMKAANLFSIGSSAIMCANALDLFTKSPPLLNPRGSNLYHSSLGIYKRGGTLIDQ